MKTELRAAQDEESATTFEYPPVGGIPIRHRYPRDWPVDTSLFTPWPATPSTDDVILVEHVVGSVDVSALEQCEGVPAEDDYFRDASGRITIRFAPSNFPTDTRYLESVRPGYHYRLYYARTPVARVYPWFRDRIVYTLSFPARGLGYIAHAFAFRHPSGFGVMCPARAGTGKSTLAGMIRSFDAKIPLLSDDRIIVRQRDSRFDICGTPWFSAASAANPECAPLGAVMLMGRSAEPTARRVEAGESMRRILQCLALPYWDAGHMERALEQVDRLVREIPVLECSYPVNVGTAPWVIDVLFKEIDGR